MFTVIVSMWAHDKSLSIKVRERIQWYVHNVEHNLKIVVGRPHFLLYWQKKNQGVIKFTLNTAFCDVLKSLSSMSIFPPGHLTK